MRAALGLLLSIGLLLLMAACGASRESAYLTDTKATTVVSEAEQKETTAKDLWDKREDPESLKQALALYEELAAAQPTRRDLLARLSRGYYLLGNGYLTEEEEILAAYDKGASWGERILGLRPEFKAKIAEGEDDYELLGLAQKEDVPGIYWSYANLGKWSVLKGFTTVLKNKSKLKAFITRVQELAPDYYYGAGDRGLGGYYAKAPSFAGGDLDLAKKHFEASLAIAPDYFGTKTLMAEYYAVKEQDRALFEKLLNEVIAGDPNVLPDVVPMQKIEQKRAKKLLAEADELFE